MLRVRGAGREFDFGDFEKYVMLVRNAELGIIEMKKYKLGEIATIYNGSTPSTKEDDNYDGEIIWATPKDLSDQQSKYFYRGSRNITKKGFNSCSTQMIPANNILMSSRAPIGLFAINKVDCCTNQGFKNIVLDKKNADVDFMYYFLKYHVKEIEALGSGTTFKEVSKASFEKYEISIPPLESQQKIAAVLSALDDKIALNRRINAKLEQMAKRLYDHWFVQFDFPSENGKPYKASGGKMVWNETLKREIPEGGEVGVFADFIEIGNGKDHSKLQSGNVPVYGSGGFMRGVKDFLYDGESVLFPRKGTLNNIMYKNEKFWTVDTMFYSKMKIPHSAVYVYYTAKQFDFVSMNTGTGVPSMTSIIIKGLPIIKPEQDVLDSFDESIQPIYKKIHQNEKESDKLTALRDKLLPLLMNGQVKVC